MTFKITAAVCVIAFYCLNYATTQSTVRPYKFGFTIEEQQHRSEKRDERGIVMGEFGFITADGIYHVTVYATDENGKFRILAMRNYPYVSAAPKTIEVVATPQTTTTTTTTTEKSKPPLPKYNFNTEACSGCFLSNGNNKKPTDASQGTKNEIRPLSLPFAPQIPITELRPGTAEELEALREVLPELFEPTDQITAASGQLPINTQHTPTTPQTQVIHTPAVKAPVTGRVTTSTNRATKYTNVDYFVGVEPEKTTFIKIPLEKQIVQDPIIHTPAVKAPVTGRVTTSTNRATKYTNVDYFVGVEPEKTTFVKIPLEKQVVQGLIVNKPLPSGIPIQQPTLLGSGPPNDTPIYALLDTPNTSTAGRIVLGNRLAPTQNPKGPSITRVAAPMLAAAITDYKVQKQAQTQSYTPQQNNEHNNNLAILPSQQPNVPQTQTGSASQTPPKPVIAGGTLTQTNVNQPSTSSLRPGSPNTQTQKGTNAGKAPSSVTGSNVQEPIDAAAPRIDIRINDESHSNPKGSRPISSSDGTSAHSANESGDLYRFKYILDYNGHTETGSRNGNKEGNYFAIGDDNIERTIEYIANEFGFQPHIRWRKVDGNALPKENSLKDFEFTWFKQE